MLQCFQDLLTLTPLPQQNISPSTIESTSTLNPRYILALIGTYFGDTGLVTFVVVKIFRSLDEASSLLSGDCVVNDSSMN